MATTLSNEKLYHSLMAGAKEVMKQKNTLNQMNVFPVADGDTGSNLASMMQTIVNESKLDASTKATLESIADAALVGARGNSGIIFAQYLNGFLIALSKGENEISLEQFIASVSEAVPYAYEAVNEPVEGTMITLMREWGEFVVKIKDNVKDFTDVLSRSHQYLKEQLEKTPEKLKVLKDNKVVDAGAKGFFHFIEGVMKFVKTGEMDDLYDDTFEPESNIPKNDGDWENESYRYCTEALITGEKLKAKDIKVAMHELGDSLVVAGNETKVRVHIHTNEPQDVFYRLRDFGHIEFQKVDDMKKQYELVNQRKNDILLVTDSIADLPKSFIDEHQVYQIPINLMIEDSNYFDKLTITSERFYQFMDELETYPTSSQPSPKQMENLFSYLSTYYKKIVVISVSAKMSGTFNVIKNAIKKIKEADIRVIDSRQNSGAQGLLVMKAQELINEGKDIDTIEKTIETLRHKVKILVSVKTLKYMVRSGRVSKVTGVIGKVANLKPVISIDETGEGIIFSKGLSLASSNKTIKKHVEKIANEKGIDRYAIVHANALNRAESYTKTFKDIIGKEPLYTIDISTVVAMNAGIGTVAIAYLENH